MSPKYLLAKWRSSTDYSWARGHTFNGHLEEVLWAYTQFSTLPFCRGKVEYPSFLHALYDMMDLGRWVEYGQFETWCFFATLTHDLGKAGGEFQRMMWNLEAEFQRLGGEAAAKQDANALWDKLQHAPRYKQGYRHEFMSAYLLTATSKIPNWIRSHVPDDTGFAYIIAGAFGHHRKSGIENAIRRDVMNNPSYVPSPVYLEMLSRDLRVLLPKKREGLAEFPILRDIPAQVMTYSGLKDKYEKMEDSPMFSQGATLIADDPISIAIKWVVILADTYGSMSMDPCESVRSCRARLKAGLQSVFSRMDTVAYQQRIRARLNGAEMTHFQKKCATTGNLLATASTGGGKTIAGLNFASKRPDLPLIFTSPTTDMGTRLYMDYGDAAQDDIRHSRAWLDRPYDPTPEDNITELSLAIDDAADMVDSLKGINSEIVFTTPDQVLGCMAFSHKSVLWLPHILRSQIVFDEPHSYDPEMTKWYLRFLDWFPKMRSAHLSATMPESLQAEIRKRTTSHGKDPKSIADSRRWGSPRRRPRYRVHILPNYAEAAAKYDAGSIWITNTVARCQEIGTAFPDALVYHSRFKFQDRRGIRDRAVQMFPNTKEADVTQPKGRLVCTQIAEMSFDVSGWSLISEMAPPASLIQRLGRICRYAMNTRVADIFLYQHEGESGLPYSMGQGWEAEYQKWMRWCSQFEGRDISQDDLEDAFQKFYADEVQKYREPKPGLLITESRNIRSASPTVECLLQSDVDAHPNMNAYMAAMLTVPALLNGEERRNLYLTKQHRKFVIPYGYDSRLGLLKN